MYDDTFEHDPDMGCEYDFSEWRYRSVIADCLRRLSYTSLANFVLRPSMDGDFIKDCLSLAQREASLLRKLDILDCLAFNGLGATSVISATKGDLPCH